MKFLKKNYRQNFSVPEKSKTSTEENTSELSSSTYQVSIQTWLKLVCKSFFEKNLIFLFSGEVLRKSGDIGDSMPWKHKYHAGSKPRKKYLHSDIMKAVEAVKHGL